MAGSWEPLISACGATGKDYTPTPEQRAAYEARAQPRDGRPAEGPRRQLRDDALLQGGGPGGRTPEHGRRRGFAKLCHDAGLRVGVYNYSGTFMWEPFFKEVPQAKDWVLLDPAGKPVTYGQAGYRYYWNRNHPDAEAFHRQIVRFAVKDIQTDLVHFDNYAIGPGYDANSIARFRHYLAQRSPRRSCRMGVTDLRRPAAGPAT